MIVAKVFLLSITSGHGPWLILFEIELRQCQQRGLKKRIEMKNKAGLEGEEGEGREEEKPAEREATMPPPRCFRDRSRHPRHPMRAPALTRTGAGTGTRKPMGAAHQWVVRGSSCRRGQTRRLQTLVRLALLGGSRTSGRQNWSWPQVLLRTLAAYIGDAIFFVPFSEYPNVKHRRSAWTDVQGRTRLRRISSISGISNRFQPPPTFRVQITLDKYPYRAEDSHRESVQRQRTATQNGAWSGLFFPYPFPWRLVRTNAPYCRPDSDTDAVASPVSIRVPLYNVDNRDPGRHRQARHGWWKVSGMDCSPIESIQWAERADEMRRSLLGVNHCQSRPLMLRRAVGNKLAVGERESRECLQHDRGEDRSRGLVKGIQVGNVRYGACTFRRAELGRYWNVESLPSHGETHAGDLLARDVSSSRDPAFEGSIGTFGGRTQGGGGQQSALKVCKFYENLRRHLQGTMRLSVGKSGFQDKGGPGADRESLQGMVAGTGSRESARRTDVICLAHRAGRRMTASRAGNPNQRRALILRARIPRTALVDLYAAVLASSGLRESPLTLELTKALGEDHCTDKHHLVVVVPSSSSSTPVPRPGKELRSSNWKSEMAVVAEFAALPKAVFDNSAVEPRDHHPEVAFTSHKLRPGSSMRLYLPTSCPWAPSSPCRSLTCQIWLTETHFSGQNAQRTSLGFFTNESL
ncbi:uncharacterized protein CLUP02_02592 [Colletotrichum lupini]|uniref:Uncharacterized protein n=1 Tax=Colletotrichum lupini TaxID=145971 RepID=A0A9Q8SHL9_9PEZI|nr:uncharacterized protein CLUP02_02592 [Colletotrichum lupini]UQC77125.1 hypothetical protein CLUP02_02592 [Colletotrichum lupini]